ncbi:MAG: acyltransferase family protein [Nitrospinota bacterium]
MDQLVKYERLSSQINFGRNTNNFDALRLFAAFLVFFSHCYPLFGLPEPEFLSSRNGSKPISFGAIAVTIFFVISGFLIPGSWEKRSEVFPYLRNRVLRIYPGLMVNFFIVYLLVLPFFCTISAEEYFQKIVFSMSWFFFFIKNLLLMRSVDLSIAFPNNPVPNMVNGPLWTLPYEFMMYIAVILAGITVGFRKYFFFIPLFFFFYFVFFSPYPVTEADLSALFFGGFISGTSLYVFRNQVPYNFPLFFLALFTLFVLSFGGFYNLSLFLLSLAYIVVYIAFCKLPYVSSAGRFGDFSYGVYIYGWPVQQVFSPVFFEEGQFWTFVAVSLFTTIIFAFFSWHLVERQALSLKRSFSSTGKRE